jgi:hypothetical protein
MIPGGRCSILSIYPRRSGSLHAQAKRINQYLAQEKDVFAYFTNDARGMRCRMRLLYSV